MSGLPYSPQNARLLHRAVMWASHAEEELRCWFSENPAVDVHAYEGSRKYCVVNNSARPSPPPCTATTAPPSRWR